MTTLTAARRAWASTFVLSTSCALFACSLLAPSDDHFFGEGAQSLAGAPYAGQAGEGGQSASTAGEGGVAGHAEGGSEAGASGASSGAGGEAGSVACGEDEQLEDGECISLSGCSDGTREAFVPLEDWPRLAGCTARWPRASLRDPKTGEPCGFELGVCAAPADACGAGWHVCAQPPYGPQELSEQATAEECAAQPGAYVAAVGDQFCEPCSAVGDGAACCGDRCVQQNGSCIYPGKTAWFGVVEGYKNVCGAIESDLVQRGVLCCRDR
jgi:hypothetical protein